MDKFPNLVGMKKLSKKKPLATNFDRVKAFMLMFGQEVVEKPEWPDAKTMELRIDLIEEELGELKDGILLGDGTLVDVADALTDLLYVIYGAGHSFGINLDKCFEEVHNSNMSKMGSDGKAVKGPTGKVMKGPNYKAPDLKKVIMENNNGK